MLIEGFVGLLALVAACTLLPDHYYAINADPKKWQIGADVLQQLQVLAGQVGEKSLVGRTGGSVTLAVGMAAVFGKLPGMAGLMAYWYHFAIMFEALFILTTVDTGTRVARFILQEMAGRAYKPLGQGTWLPGVILTSAAVSGAWYYLVHGGTVGTIWPMFGIANQLLGVVALAVGTTYILLHARRRRYALVTFLPCLFMAITVLTAGVQFTRKVLFLAPAPDYVKGLLTIAMMVLAVLICVACTIKWGQILTGKCAREACEITPGEDLLKLAEGTEIPD